MAFKIFHGLEIKTEIFSTSVGIPFSVFETQKKIFECALKPSKEPFTVMVSESDVDCLAKFIPAQKAFLKTTKNGMLEFKSSSLELVLMVDLLNKQVNSFVAA